MRLARKELVQAGVSQSVVIAPLDQSIAQLRASIEELQGAAPPLSPGGGQPSAVAKPPGRRSGGSSLGVQGAIPARLVLEARGARRLSASRAMMMEGEEEEDEEEEEDDDDDEDDAEEGRSRRPTAHAAHAFWSSMPAR